MSTQPAPDRHPSAENDALTWADLRRHLLWWARLLGNTLRFFTDVLRRHWRTSLPVIALFAALFVWMLYNRAQSYRLQTTFVYDELHPKIYGDMVNRLNDLIAYDRTDKVAGLMHLSPSQAEKIQRIEVTDARGKALSDNYALRREPMTVALQLAAPLDEDSLRDALNAFLNGNPFTAERLELKKQLWQEELAYLDQKIQTIDSVLTNLYARPPEASRETGAVTIESSEGKNAYELLRISREMMDRKAEVRTRLSHPENVVAIDNFLVLPQARLSAGSVTFYAVTGAAVGFFLASALVYWRRYVRPVL